MRSPSRAFVFVSLQFVSLIASGQNITSFEEQRKQILSPSAVAAVGTDLFGDSINFYNGALDFTQTDVSLPGNNTLPVSIGRRIKTGQRGETCRPFGQWELDVPHVYGIFARSDGWKDGFKGMTRCSKFGAPPTATSNNGSAYWDYDEFWKGSYLYVPGKGAATTASRSLQPPCPGACCKLSDRHFQLVGSVLPDDAEKPFNHDGPGDRRRRFPGYRTGWNEVLLRLVCPLPRANVGQALP